LLEEVIDLSHDNFIGKSKNYLICKCKFIIFASRITNVNQMKNISERIKEILAYYHLTAGEFAVRLGVQKSSISHLLSGRNKPSFLFITKLIEAFPDLNIKWFLTGDGEMIEEDKESAKHEAGKIKEKKEYDFTEQENFVDASFSEETDNKNETLKNTDQLYEKKNEVKNIIMLYDNDTFKILNKAD